MSSFMLPIPRPAKQVAKKASPGGPPGPAPQRSTPPTPFGHPLAVRVQAEMSRRFGERFDDVRVHTGAEAAARAQSAGAAAYTIGREVVFGAGRYAPETPGGRESLAHELAHVVQQRRTPSGDRSGTSPGPSLELEARAAGAAFRDGAGPIRVAGAGLPALARQTPEEAAGAQRESLQRRQRTLDLVDPELLAAFQQAGLARQSAPRDVGLPPAQAARVHRPAPAFDPAQAFRNVAPPAPPDPQTLKQAAEVRTQIGRLLLGGTEILSIFRAAGERGFVKLQENVDMNKVLGKLDDWEIVQLGALGPIVGSSLRKRVNETRADFLADRTRHWGPARAQIFAAYMITNMTDDDLRAVLGLLAADQNLESTIDQMPEIGRLLAARGIDRGAFQDRGGKASDIFTGIKHLAESAASSTRIGKDIEGGRAGLEGSQLPEPFSTAYWDNEMAALRKALSPGNLLFAATDAATLGILSGVKGVVYDLPRAAISGIRELSKGHVAGGVEQLTGAAVTVVALVLGVRGFRKSMRIAAMLELTPEGGALYEGLVGKLGKRGIDDVAKWTRASAEAQILVREEGAAGIDALHAARGNVAAARRAIGGARRVEEITKPLSHTVGGLREPAKPPETKAEGVPLFSPEGRAGIEAELEKRGAGAKPQAAKIAPARVLADKELEQAFILKPGDKGPKTVRLSTLPKGELTTRGGADPEGLYLYTVDRAGLKIAREEIPFPTERGKIVHTNLSPPETGALAGGELRFISQDEVIINGGSGRYGPRTLQEWQAVISLFQEYGFKVHAVPFNAR